MEVHYMFLRISQTKILKQLTRYGFLNIFRLEIIIPNLVL